jgi:hypothetical protein
MRTKHRTNMGTQNEETGDEKWDQKGHPEMKKMRTKKGPK